MLSAQPEAQKGLDLVEILCRIGGKACSASSPQPLNHQSQELETPAPSEGQDSSSQLSQAGASTSSHNTQGRWHCLIFRKYGD